MRAILAILTMMGLFAADPAAERLRRFNDAKFGMFIHWGPYSLASVEASWPIMRPTPGIISEQEYRSLPGRFNPVQFDPTAWVRLAKAAGQRYMVFTSKHHDGFCMFDSLFTEYKITKTPYGKDIAKMLTDAAKEEKMPFGFYYSPPDMNHPGFRDTSKLSSTNWQGEPQRPEWPLYLDYMELQIKELLSGYGDLFVVWFDGLGQQQKYDGIRFHKLIRELQPMALINNRIGLTGDYVTPEQRVPKGIPLKGARVGNTDPKDQGLSAGPPEASQFQPWETCMTINDTWAYNKNDRKFKSTTEIIRTLIDVASKGGNFLLNVGPTPEGTIQPEFEERLLATGKWLETNGEAIYGTTYGPLQNLSWGRTTARGRTVYLHIYDWPSGPLTIEGLKANVAKATLLAGRKPVPVESQAGRLILKLPAQAPDTHASVVALELR